MMVDGIITGRMALLAASVCLVACLALASGCSSASTQDEQGQAGLEGDDAALSASTLSGGEVQVGSTFDSSSLSEAGIAALVGDVAVMDADVDGAISSERDVRGLADNTAWTDYLKELGYTPEEYRAKVLEDFVRRLVMNSEAQARGIAVSDEELEAELESLKEADGEEEYANALVAAGLSEEEYLPVLRAYLNEQRLIAADVDGDGSSDGSAAFEEWYRRAREEAPVAYAAGE